MPTLPITPLRHPFPDEFAHGRRLLADGEDSVQPVVDRHAVAVSSNVMRPPEARWLPVSTRPVVREHVCPRVENFSSILDVRDCRPAEAAFALERAHCHPAKMGKIKLGQNEGQISNCPRPLASRKRCGKGHWGLLVTSANICFVYVRLQSLYMTRNVAIVHDNARSGIVEKVSLGSFFWEQRLTFSRMLAGVERATKARGRGRRLMACLPIGSLFPIGMLQKVHPWWRSQ
jgi:hypothetical protein